MLAFLFVLAPGLLAFKLIRRWHQAVVPIFIVAVKLTELAPCPCTGLYWEPRAIYRMWFFILLAIVMLRRRRDESGWGTGLNPA